MQLFFIQGDNARRVHQVHKGVGNAVAKDKCINYGFVFDYFVIIPPFHFFALPNRQLCGFKAACTLILSTIFYHTILLHHAAAFH
ncbi:hypothetical protein [Kingella kingae]|uniref:hypothetical protein n=1 Tax=Kingella kingae TaxID=504 RepID=UPI001E59252C|nr:hypothetical protein [Kingella kingae]MDK4545436.1 hypothetical protein [Kingella kingae]